MKILLTALLIAILVFGCVSKEEKMGANWVKSENEKLGIINNDSIETRLVVTEDTSYLKYVAMDKNTDVAVMDVGTGISTSIPISEDWWIKEFPKDTTKLHVCQQQEFLINGVITVWMPHTIPTNKFLAKGAQLNKGYTFDMILSNNHYCDLTQRLPDGTWTLGEHPVLALEELYQMYEEKIKFLEKIYLDMGGDKNKLP